MHFHVLLVAIATFIYLQVHARPLNDAPQSEYDYIVVGGGTAGLTVARRLTEDPDVTVLVLEAGPADQGEDIIRIPGRSHWPGNPYVATYQTVAQTHLDGQARNYPQGRGLGGGTLINGMLWNRGRQDDFNFWGLFNTGWSWNDLLPYFKKTETFTPLQDEAEAAWYSVGFDPDYHGFDGPVNVSYPNYFYNTSANFVSGLNSLSIPTVMDPNSANASGASYLPLNIDPTDQSRSTSRRAYYDPVAGRDNYYVRTGSTVTRLVPDLTTVNATVKRFIGVEVCHTVAETTNLN